MRRAGMPPAPPPAVTLPSAAPRHLGCLTHPSIDAWEQRLRSERRLWAAFVHGVARGKPYLTRLRQIVAEAGLPPSLALLPALESGFRPRAASPSGSRGLWQLQPATARRFGLVVNTQRDERLDPELATRAAATYLRVLHERYDDWPLALAAYNAGEGRVDRALAGQPGATLWSLAAERRLPRTSDDYVARFLALVRVLGDAPACG